MDKNFTETMGLQNSPFLFNFAKSQFRGIDQLHMTHNFIKIFQVYTSWIQAVASELA